jgi:NADH-quinone oxidoreductase subunit G
LSTDNIDFRARAASAEEAQFLASNIAGRTLTTTYRNLDSASNVLMIAFEPEDESPIVLLRLRAAVKNGTRVHTIAPTYSLGSHKLDAHWIQCAPGAEATAIGSLDADLRTALSQPGAVVLVGERAASIPGALSAVSALVASTGAHLGWIPRRAGERGALEAGAIAGLLPSGRPITDPEARTQVAKVWNVDPQSLPQTGISGAELISAIANKKILAIVTGGVQAADLPEGAELLAALDSAEFVVALETHHSEITQRADVVFPVAVVTEKAGTFMDWEGRAKPFAEALRDALTLSDAGVLAMLASASGHTWTGDTRALRSEFAQLSSWQGAHAAAPSVAPSVAPAAADNQSGFTLATWRQLLDSGLMQEGEPHLAATARPSVVRICATDSAALGSPAALTVSGPKGSVTLPTEVAEVVQGTVWLPMNSPDSHIYEQLGCGYGDSVNVTAAATSVLTTGGGA